MVMKMLREIEYFFIVRDFIIKVIGFYFIFVKVFLRESDFVVVFFFNIFKKCIFIYLNDYVIVYVIYFLNRWERD